jgi:eukaryotic-like serine/threonine-protein kinase
VPDPAVGEDASNEKWISLLDAFLTAIQRGDVTEQRRLLNLAPELSSWANDLQDIDAFATILADPLAIRTQTSDAHESIRFGKYELRGELGRGGMGVVFRAYHSELDRMVALKMLTGSSFTSPEQRCRFAQEARLASRIRHPHIVSIHDIGDFGGQPYFTMDIVTGTSVASCLRQGPIPTEQAVHWMIMIAKAVDHLHANGIIHRDLKPSNVLLDECGEPCLVDFGLARALDEFHDPTVTGTILGTPSYMSPEQAAGRIREVSTRSDVYSLGAIFYEMLCGRPPFKADSAFDTVLQVMEREPLPLRHWNRAVPKRLEQICLRCLEKSPGKRYPSALEFAHDLERWVCGERSPYESLSPITRFSRTFRRYPHAAYRLLALLPTLLIVALRCLATPNVSTVSDYYTPIIAELSLWIGLSLVWEWLASKPGEQRWTRYAFLWTDIIFMTSILQARKKADISHVTAYALVLILSGLSLNRSQIWTAGMGCVAGYLCLLYHAEDFESWIVPILVVVLLTCCAIVTDYQACRLSIWIRGKDKGKRIDQIKV